MAPTNPEKIGRYQVLERVGRGGMGVLFRGIDPVLEREVAIKLMLVDFSEDEEQMRPRFYREARAAAKLQHRNIVTVFEFAEEGSTPYIVMEFLRGDSLAARMSSPIPLTLDDKLAIISQLCAALHYAHAEGVVHRDVKPANIFLLNDGTVKLLDFGIAKVMTSNLTRTGDVLGSASYMSPEQVSGSGTLDGRSDIFSVGVVLYELLAGIKPFHAEVPTAIIMKILHEPPAPLEQFAPGLPAPLVAAVNKALAKNPAERFGTAGELGKELELIRKSLQASGEGAAAGLEETRFASATEIRSFQKDAIERPSIAKQTTPAATAGGRKWLVPAVVGAVIVLVAAVALVLGLRLRNSSPPPAGEAVNAATAANQAAAAALQPSAPAAAPAPSADPASVPPTPTAGAETPAGAAPAALASATPAASQPTQDARPAAGAAPAAALPAPPAVPEVPAAAKAAEPPVGTSAAKPADASTARSAPADPAETAAALATQGTLFIDFVNSFPDGSVEVEIDGRRRWSEKLGLSQQASGLSRIKLQRVSEQLGSELKLPAGNHKIAVTLLNAEGEVRDIATTSLNVYAQRSVTLRIRQTRFKNKLQLESAAGEPGQDSKDGK